MANYAPVGNDPFAPPQPREEFGGDGPLVVTVRPDRRSEPTFTPVDHDPFADAQPGAQSTAGGPQVAMTEEDTARLEAGMTPIKINPPSRSRSALLGSLQGTMFNGGDEIISGINAGVDYLTGQAPKGLGAAYDARLEDARRQIDEAEAAYPEAFLAGQVGGGILTAPLIPLKAGIAGGLATGAIYGTIGGFGSGEGVGDRLVKAGVGGIVGAGVGAAVPAIAGGAKTAYNWGKQAVSNATGFWRGALNPEVEASRRIQAAMARDAAMGGKQMDEAALAAAQRAGQPVRVADMGGETTRALARSAANTSPEGRAVLQEATDGRFQTQAARAVEYVQRLVGSKGDAGATREGLKAAAKKANRNAYGRAYAQGAANVWDETLARIAQAPAVQAEIRDATRRSANKAASEGFPPVQNPFVAAADGSLSLKPGVSPSLQFWDVVKQGLDDQIDKLVRAGQKSEAADLMALRDSLKKHLDDLVPAYSVARKGASAAFGAEDALEAGQKFVTSNMTNNDARRAVAKMSEPERKLFAEGFASSLIEAINRAGDRRNVINQIWGTPRARERVEIALGKERAKELEEIGRAHV